MAENAQVNRVSLNIALKESTLNSPLVDVKKLIRTLQTKARWPGAKKARVTLLLV